MSKFATLRVANFAKSESHFSTHPKLQYGISDKLEANELHNINGHPQTTTTRTKWANEKPYALEALNCAIVGFRAVCEETRV